MDEGPEHWKGASQCWLAGRGSNDLGNQRLVRLQPMFQEGRELPSAFKHREAYLFRVGSAEN